MAKKKFEQMDDEIDLFGLVQSIWKEKVLIVAVTAIITLIGLGYALLIPPTFEAKVEILPPSISDIAEFNKFNSVGYSQTQTHTQANVFKDFLSILRSNQLRKNFLHEESVMKSLTRNETTMLQAIEVLDNMIQLKVHKSDVVDKVSLKLQYNDAELVAKFANQLVELAIQQYRTNVALEFDSQRDQKIKQLNDKKNSLLSTHEYRLDQEITKLKQAYTIAQKLNIIEPRESKDQTVKTESRSSVITEEMRYLYSQGTKSLNAEIETVSHIKKDLHMVNGLIEIEQALSLLDATSFDAAKVTPITIDLAAETPQHRIKPNRTLIVLQSVFIGGFLAILFVLIRNAVLNRKLHS